VGPLTVPSMGAAYLDANAFIYTVERMDPYRAVLDPFWSEVRTAGAVVVTSELTLLEVLVGPLKSGDAALEASYRAVLGTSPDVRMLPISRCRAGACRAVACGYGFEDARRHPRRDGLARRLSALRDQRPYLPPRPRPERECTR
jgi:PIN domain